MKKLMIACALCGLFAAGSCDRENLVESEESARPVYIEILDIDQDGEPELILGFEREDLVRLPGDQVTLEGLFSSTNTRFETDLFRIDP